MVKAITATTATTPKPTNIRFFGVSAGLTCWTWRFLWLNHLEVWYARDPYQQHRSTCIEAGCRLLMTTFDDEMVARAVFEARTAEEQPRTYAAVFLMQRAAENCRRLARARRRGSSLDPAALSCGCLSGLAIDEAHPPNKAAAKIGKVAISLLQCLNLLSILCEKNISSQ